MAPVCFHRLMVTAYGGGSHWAGTVSLGEPAAVTLSASVPLSAPSTCLLSPPLYLAAANDPAGHHLHFGDFTAGNCWALISGIAVPSSHLASWQLSTCDGHAEIWVLLGQSKSDHPIGQAPPHWASFSLP